MENDEMTNDAAVAEIRNKFGDPEAFAERELVVTGDIQRLPIGTTLVPATTVAELRADVVSTNARCIELGERIARLADLRASDAAYIKKLDGIIEETGVRPVSCINPYEDLKAVVLWQKKRIESLESAPDGSWLWGKLMDWCGAQGVSPATQDSLFAIATEAHRRAALTKETP